MSDTKEKILDAAEKLFADHGFSATSLRMITAEAGANLAAVNYHFRSKDALIEAVFARRLSPINQQRLQLLDECEAAAGDAPLPLEPVIKAFVGPVLAFNRELAPANSAFRRLLGRMYTEPENNIRQLFQEQLSEIARRFTAASRRALPDLPLTELMWRLNFAVGVMAHTVASPHRIRELSGGLCDPSDVDGAIKRMVTFIAAGLRAPLPASVGER